MEEVLPFLEGHRPHWAEGRPSGFSRWDELTRGSVVRRVLRAAAEQGIDVHVIARRGLGQAEPGGGAAGAWEEASGA